MKNLYILLICIIILLLIDEVTMKFFIKKSPIHGHGVFATRDYKINEQIFDQMMDENNIPDKEWDAPIKYVNHSYDGNMLMKRRLDGKWEARAAKDIFAGNEIVSNYNKSPPFVKDAKPHYV
jgi:hypothetical protein